MTINEIIEELKYSTKEFPTEAILGARKNKQEVTEILLNNLQEIIDNPDIIFDNELHDFSLYLLAEFKEKRAFPLIIKILNQFDEEDLDYMLGDILTEDLSSILASTFNGDFYSLLNIIENKDKDEFLRASVLDTLAILYNKNIIHKDALLKYLENILEQYENDYDFITSEISCIVCDFKLYELVPKIENLYKGNKLDEKFMKLKDFKEFLDKPPFTTYDYIDDCISSMAWIFRPEHYYSRKDFKIGRNDPCPCGSGKKYKKCCGK